jgi:nucleotide-binding universal stress UspA family protein
MPTASSDSPPGLDTVLVPTDFTRGAEVALGRALRLPLRPEGRLHVLHVMPSNVSADAVAETRGEAERRMEAFVSEVGAASVPGLRVTTEVLSGTAFVEIVRCSRTIGADLIVMGRHGRRAIRDMFIGSTAARVVRKGSVPVLLVNTRPTRPYQNVLVATDYSDASHVTVELTLRLVDRVTAKIHLVHAYQVPFERHLTRHVAARDHTEYRKQYKRTAESAMRDFLAPHRDDARWKAAVRAGDPRVVILGEAKRRHVDLISIGTHGRAGVSHALLGSVAEWVIEAGRCDVLVARPVRYSFELP